MKKGMVGKLGLFGVAVMVILALISVGKRSSANIVRGHVPAWDFTLMDLQDKPVKLSDYRGKVLLVNFWASWGTHWRAEMPILNELYDKYRDRGFEIISVSLDDGGVGDVKPAVEPMRLNYKVVMGNESVSADYRIRKIPTTYLIDRRGIIRGYYEGARAKTTLEKDIKNLLEAP